MALLFFVYLPPILHFVLYELCYEYNMKFSFVTFPCRRSGCGRACMRGICLPVEFYVRVRVEHEQSIMSLSRDCSFVGVSLCFIFQCIRKQYSIIFQLILCSIFRDKSFSQMRSQKSATPPPSWKVQVS